MVSIAFLARSTSLLGERVAALLGGECRVLGLADARVTVEDRSVIWQGCALERCGAVFVEAPLVGWPQPLAEPRAGELVLETQRRGFAARERRSLHVSALRVAAASTCVVNAPAPAALIAQSPALALERLEAAGVPVRPWRLSSDSRVSGARLEPTAECGARAALGASALAVEPASSGVRAHLCLGGHALAATASHAAIVCAGEPLELARESAAAERELALRALAELGLDFGCVHVSDGAVAFVESVVDLDAWDRAGAGRVAHALAQWLPSAANSRAIRP